MADSDLPSRVSQEDCTHQQFKALVKVARLEDSGKFMAEITVTCSDCQEPFRFVGVPAGVNFERPAVSINGLELRAPIEPQIEAKLTASASFQMPDIPRRH